jgi:tight adherence protein B
MIGAFILFLMFLVIYGAGVLIWWKLRSEKQRQQLVKNLSTKVNPEGTVRTTVLIEKPTRASGISSMFRTGRSASNSGKIDKLSKARFLMMTLGGIVCGFILGMNLTGFLGVLSPLIFAFVGGFIPRMYRSKNRDKRLGAIEEQFPDALDFLARSVKAGNAFSIALELLGSEASEPLKSEIVKMTREMALGANLEDALHGLISRIPLLEVRMFVAAVLLQRETGGNLSEVLFKLAVSVRERLRLRGHVKAASGQGRLTANVLSCMPLAIALMLQLVSPNYLHAMIDTDLGRNLLGGAVIFQMTGYLVMQKMIKIEI